MYNRLYWWFTLLTGLVCTRYTLVNAPRRNWILRQVLMRPLGWVLRTFFLGPEERWLSGEDD
jgi:hypothetical protein